MGLPVILSALHLASFFRPQAEKDPEKGEVQEDDQSGVGGGQHGEEEHDLENELDEDGDLVNDPLEGPNRLHRVGSATHNTFFSSSMDEKGLPEYLENTQPWYKRIKSYVFPKEESAASLEKFVPNYRWTPIISGVVVPFSILLEIPGLTEHWYVRTEENDIVETKTNPAILDIGLAISMACALAANICLVMRFLEKRVKTVTLLTIVFLTVHDLINIVAITIFGVEHRFDDGFTYGQSFWLTVCSTIASTITNVTVIVDYVRTPQFSRSGSGLTRKQRALVIIVIVLLVYVAFGALINSLIMSLNFVDGLYFTVVTIETIGFGDIHPTNTGTRVFTCCYMAFGIINVGVAVAMTRETVLEGLELGYRKRVRVLRKRRLEAKRYRRWEMRWRRAVEWRLREAGQPTWVSDRRYSQERIRFVGLKDGKEGSGEVHWMRKWLESMGLRRIDYERRAPHLRGHPPGKHLNIDALSIQQLEAAALEAGVPLEMFLSLPHKVSEHHHHKDDQRSHAGSHRDDKFSYRKWFRHRTNNDWPSALQTPTHAQVGRISAILTKFALAVTGTHVHMLGHPPETHEHLEREAAQGVESGKDNVWSDEQNTVANGAETDNRRSGERAEGGQGLVTEGSLLPRIPEPVKGVVKDGSEAFGLIRDQDIDDDGKYEEKRAYLSKLLFAWSIFFFFWFVGSAIFHATEGWPYGDAMYFCFLAFTTTGYGDFAPASPAGRSIFVVWALMGVATMTILIAVIEEAGSSKYKNALHSKAFDNAVKKFRLRENRKTEAIAAHARPGVPRTHSDISLQEATQAASIAAQHELEKLPNQVLQQAKTFHSHVQYLVNNADTNWEDTRNPDSAMARCMSRTSADLRALLDEISNLEEIGERAKKDIMEDDDTRNTLLILSIETNLRRLINAAQRSLGALAERDSLLALQRQREYEGRASSSHAPSADSDTIQANERE